MLLPLPPATVSLINPGIAGLLRFDGDCHSSEPVVFFVQDGYHTRKRDEISGLKNTQNGCSIETRIAPSELTQVRSTKFRPFFNSKYEPFFQPEVCDSVGGFGFPTTPSSWKTDVCRLKSDTQHEPRPCEKHGVLIFIGLLKRIFKSIVRAGFGKYAKWADFKRRSWRRTILYHLRQN